MRDLFEASVFTAKQEATEQVGALKSDQDEDLEGETLEGEESNLGRKFKLPSLSEPQLSDHSAGFSNGYLEVIR